MAKKEVKPLPALIRDTREHFPEHGWQWNKTKEVDGTIEQKLDVGDYAIAGLETEFVVERKGSPGELINNLFSEDKERFIRELEKLTSFKRAWIICEFTLDDVAAEIAKIASIRRCPVAKFYINMDGFLGYVASLDTQYNVRFIFTGKEKRVYSKTGHTNINYGKDLAKKLLLKSQKYLVK